MVTRSPRGSGEFGDFPNATATSPSQFFRNLPFSEETHNALTSTMETSLKAAKKNDPVWFDERSSFTAFPGQPGYVPKAVHPWQKLGGDEFYEQEDGDTRDLWIDPRTEQSSRFSAAKAGYGTTNGGGLHHAWAVSKMGGGSGAFYDSMHAAVESGSFDKNVDPFDDAVSVREGGRNQDWHKQFKVRYDSDDGFRSHIDRKTAEWQDANPAHKNHPAVRSRFGVPDKLSPPIGVIKEWESEYPK